uniref:Reverse transcriptase domain-containing protein n=1 Tax=Plectus sambesii TaxID=2011161 RepID=A0A914XEP0_9BILA
MIDHIHVVNELVQKVMEYHLPLYMAFVDYKKAFDLVENYYVWQALKRQQVPMPIISVLKKIYNEAKSTFCIGNTSIERRIDELITASSTIGLKVNVKKTKTMTNFPGTASLSFSGEPIEEVNEFVYLGQLVSFPRDHYTEIK